MKFAEALPLLSERQDDFEDTLANGIGGVLKVNPNKISLVSRSGNNFTTMEIRNGSVKSLAGVDRFGKLQIQTTEGFWRVQEVTSTTDVAPTGASSTKIEISLTKVK